MDYGWPIRLGYAKPIVEQDKYAVYNFDPDKYVKPIWSNGKPTLAPTGMTFYNASKYTDFANDLFFLTLNDISLHRVKLKPPSYNAISEFYTYQLDIDSIPTDIEIGQDDELYVSALNNRIYKVTFEPLNFSNAKIAYISLSIPEEIEDSSKDVIFFAKLTDENGEPIFYRPINFELNGNIIATVRTNEKGIARISIDPELLGAINIISTKFLGDEEYVNASETKTIINSGKYSNVTILESVIYKGKIAKVYMFDVNKNSVEYGKEVTFMTTLTDNEGNILDEEYTFIIKSNDNKILLEESNKGPNLHRYSFREDNIGKVSIIIRDSNGKEAEVKINVIPEFPLVYIVFAAGLAASMIFAFFIIVRTTTIRLVP